MSLIITEERQSLHGRTEKKKKKKNIKTVLTIAPDMKRYPHNIFLISQLKTYVEGTH